MSCRNYENVMKKVCICVHNWYIYNRNHDDCDRNQREIGSVWEGVELYQKDTDYDKE